VTQTLRSRDELADEWLNSGSMQTLPSPASAKSYPKRSELRRAEARAASRRGADRRPPGNRPPGAAAGKQRPPSPAAAGRSAEPVRRQSNTPWLPIAVAPTAAVLPIRQTATSTRPAGIDLRVAPQIAPDAFHQAPTGYAPMPIAVPAYEPSYDDGRAIVGTPYDDGATPPPMAPAEFAAPVVPSFDPADWGLDIDAAPATGRRKGAQPETAPANRRPQTGSLPLPARLFGRGKSGAARLLVLALVVGAEGVAVTTMSGHARTAPVDPSTATIAGAYEFTAASPAGKVKPGASAAQQQLLVAEQQEADAVAKAQGEASSAKVTVALQQAKAAADRVKLAAQRRDRAMRDAQKDPRAVGRIMAADRGWGASQFSCLNLLWNRESQWRYNAANPGSSAYGIPQSLAGPDGVPGSKMASAGADWRTNPVTQIKWGLSYIADTYGTPCGAWGHSESQGWY
jgi:hypothetical protein